MGVVRLEITRREPVLDGAYEKIDGVLHFSADPAARQNEPIADLGLAPRNGAGSWSTRRTSISCGPLDGGAAPAAARRAQPRAQGRARHVQQHARARPIPTHGEDFGNGFLMRHGYTVAWVGWQPDVPRRTG